MRRIGLSKLMVFILVSIVGLNAYAKDISIGLSGLEGVSPSINLVFQGEIYDSENTYKAIEQRIEKGEGLPVEKFLLGFLAASKIPDREKILQFWAVDERSAIGALMDNPEMWESNRKLFQRIDRSILMATMDMGEYTLAYVSHHYRGSDRLAEKVYPIKKVGDQLFLTNDLEKNSFFFRFSDLLADHLSQEVLELED